MHTVIGNDVEEMRRILFIAALLVSFVSAYGETYSGDGIVLKLEGDSIWVNDIGMNRSDAFFTEYRDEYVIYHFKDGMVSEFGYTMEGYRIWFYIYIDNRFHEYEVFKLNI